MKYMHAHYKCRRRKTLVDSESAKLLMPKNCIIRNGDIFGNNGWGEWRVTWTSTATVDLGLGGANGQFYHMKKDGRFKLIKHPFCTCTDSFFLGCGASDHRSYNNKCHQEPITLVLLVPPVWIMLKRDQWLFVACPRPISHWGLSNRKVKLKHSILRSFPLPR